MSYLRATTTNKRKAGAKPTYKPALGEGPSTMDEESCITALSGAHNPSPALALSILTTSSTTQYNLCSCPAATSTAKDRSQHLAPAATTAAGTGATGVPGFSAVGQAATNAAKRTMNYHSPYLNNNYYMFDSVYKSNNISHSYLRCRTGIRFSSTKYKSKFNKSLNT